MVKANNKQRKRVAKTLSKAFRKLEVGRQPTQNQQPQPQPTGQAGSTTRQARRRQRQEALRAPKKAQKDSSEQKEFNREQASLHERCAWKKGGSSSRKKQNPRVIDLQPPIFTGIVHDEPIERGIAALEGIGGNINYLTNGSGEAASSFLLQQTQKKAAAVTAMERENRFAALLENNIDIDSMPADQFAPTQNGTGDKEIITFPPPILPVHNRPLLGAMGGQGSEIPRAPSITSLDSLDV
ncbi:hypothetical protein MPSEU_000216100 [Mayamaea pseudoterrestris]|nr:hypothetical protein MPSEU_000216100 [Mayamaea pseudoterrestris]